MVNVPLDLPVLDTSQKDTVLEDMVRSGLTFSDCVAFFAKHQSEEALALAIRAKELREEGYLEFDDIPIVSEGEESQNAYVMAWVWVSK